MTVIIDTSVQQFGKLHNKLFIKYGKIEQLVVSQTHNLKVVSSNPAEAIWEHSSIGRAYALHA